MCVPLNVRIHLTLDSLNRVGYPVDGLHDRGVVLVVLLAERMDGRDDDAADGGDQGDGDGFH